MLASANIHASTASDRATSGRPRVNAQDRHQADHDDGRGASADPVQTGPGQGGNGLRGMRERINLYDGSLAAGPAAGGGFQVSAFLPYTEA